MPFKIEGFNLFVPVKYCSSIFFRPMTFDNDLKHLCCVAFQVYSLILDAEIKVAFNLLRFQLLIWKDVQEINSNVNIEL